MPVPTAYDEAQLAAFLVTALSNVASVLAWTATTPEIGEAVLDTALALGVTDVADATDVAAVRVLGERAVLRRAQTALAALVDQNVDQVDFKRSQVGAAVTKRLAVVEAAALRYDRTGYAVGVGTRVYQADPYSYLPDTARTA
jgi:hypothetical protein